MLRVITHYFECRYAKCKYSECRGAKNKQTDINVFKGHNNFYFLIQSSIQIKAAFTRAVSRCVFALQFTYIYDNNFTSIYTFMKHSVLQTLLKALALHSLETLSDIRIKAFTLLF